MRPVLGLVFLAFLLMAVSPARADTTVKAEIEKTSLTTDELLTYKLIIASTEKNIPYPGLPDFKDWAIISQAQSSTVSLQKAGTQTVLVYAFILLPKKAGKLKIGPAKVTVKGQNFSSENFEIEVKPGNASLPEEPEPDIPESDQPKYSL
jgi:hypothetical protein